MVTSHARRAPVERAGPGERLVLRRTGVRGTQAPATVVVLVAAAGVLVAALVDWEAGCVVVGLAMLLAAGLRLSLPARRAGVLVVRGRAFDAGLLLVLGFGLVLLATSVPRG